MDILVLSASIKDQSLLSQRKGALAKALAEKVIAEELSSSPPSIVVKSPPRKHQHQRRDLEDEANMGIGHGDGTGHDWGSVVRAFPAMNPSGEAYLAKNSRGDRRSREVICSTSVTLFLYNLKRN